MGHHKKNHGNGQQQNHEWKRILFPLGRDLASPKLVSIEGPFGNGRLATTDDLMTLVSDAEEHPDRFMRLFPAWAVAHDPNASVFSLNALPIPLGKVAPNALAIGRSGSGKTQKFTLAAAVDAIRNGHSFIYLNVKGKAQTGFLRRLAKQHGREHEIKVLAPLKPDLSLGCTLLYGCSELPVAGEVAKCLFACAAGESRNGEGAWCYNQGQEWTQHALAAICSKNHKNLQILPELRKVVLSGDYKQFADEHFHFPVLAKFARYHLGGNRNAETVEASIGEATAWIDDIAAILSADEFIPENFANDGGIVIIEIDEFDIERLRGFTTLLLGRLISAMQRKACENPYGCLPNRTWVIIDELAAAGPVPGLWNTLHTCRERGFSFVACAQSVEQFQSTYGNKGNVVLQGFQTQIALGGSLDPVSADYFSRKSGAATIAVPSVIEEWEEDGQGLETTRNWQITSRPVLLPSDIASPASHPILGTPATFFMGDGKTPPFQAYLTPAYEIGQLERLMDADSEEENYLREVPLKAPRLSSCSGGFTNVQGWTMDEIVKKLESVKKEVHWDKTFGPARVYWLSLERENKSKMDLMLRLAEELLKRKSNIAEFYFAHIDGGCRDILGTLFYLDYLRIKKTESPVKENQEPESKTEPMERCPSCYSVVKASNSKCRICGVKRK